jgi:hypothetical protein
MNRRKKSRVAHPMRIREHDCLTDHWLPDFTHGCLLSSGSIAA